ncbi:MAG: D-tyrosyl-tRNA(Tyr) deacylase [Bacteroidetes bacterium]|nr:D-tyrosyl-tRNA(Tyr) deacylase [Bacteroidota bacterium]
MRAVIQRVRNASVTINGLKCAAIGQGLLVFIGIEHNDSSEDVSWLSKKISQLRIFNDGQGIMNLDIRESDGEIIVVSQFTLHAKTKKGNRPSYIHAARPETAIPIYNAFVEHLKQDSGRPVQTGEFGAMMDVGLVNDGPVTIWIDTKNRE